MSIPAEIIPGSRLRAPALSLDEDPISNVGAAQVRLLRARSPSRAALSDRHRAREGLSLRFRSPSEGSAPCSRLGPFPAVVLRLAAAYLVVTRVILYGRGVTDVVTVDARQTWLPALESEVETLACAPCMTASKPLLPAEARPSPELARSPGLCLCGDPCWHSAFAACRAMPVSNPLDSERF